MKILVLRFKNIHSLKGAQLIDFTVSPLSDAGLFAITGPTGAGKSTILDVITLALFNKIPRFAPKGTESISKTDIEKYGSLMTHYSEDAYAEIEYECRGQQYRSKWSIIRKKEKLRDYEMELATLPDGQILDLKKSQVPAENERILGLKYEQFIRSILLSQGDFARFLRSDDKERAKLLEDITGSQIYREIGKKIYEKTKAKEEELNQIRQKANMLDFFSSETIAEMKAEMDHNKILSEKVQLEITTLNVLCQNLESLVLLQAKLKESIKQKEYVEQRKITFEISALRLKKHQELQPSFAEMTLWKNEKQRHTHLLDERSLVLSKIAQEDINSLAIFQEISDFLKIPVTDAEIIDKILNFEKQITQFDQFLSQCKIQGDQSRNTLNATLSKYGYLDDVKSLAQIKGFDVQLTFAQDRLEYLSQLPIIFDGKDQDLKLAIQDATDHLHRLNRQYEDALKFQKLQVALQQTLIKKEHQVLEKVNLDSSKSIAESELEKSKKRLALLQKDKEDLLKITNLEDLRQTLSDGDPCPLCGAIHHPYSTEHFITDLGKIELDIQMISRQIIEQELEVKKTTTQITRIESDLIHLSGLIASQ
ncbi:MAG: AAA family ATPase, partial [Saprospiraceae bacterium]